MKTITKSFIGLTIPNILIVLVSISILFYLFYFFANNIKEGMEKSPAIGVKLCNDNRCMPGCIKPRFLSNNCESSIYKDKDGKCFMKCSYECQSPLDKCMYNDCCNGCGKTKVEVPCIGFRKTQNYNPGIAQDQNDTMDMTEIVYNDAPVGKADGSTTMNSSIKAKALDEMMNNVNDIYDVKKGYKLRYPGNMLCSVNITNTFTECGIPPYNSPSYE